jgi:hypothetical protein
VSRRLLVRSAPLVLGAVAAGLWLRHRRPQRPALRDVTGELPPPVPPAPPRPRRPATARFVRAARRRPIDIVEIVDDLLGAAR